MVVSLFNVFLFKGVANNGNKVFLLEGYPGAHLTCARVVGVLQVVDGVPALAPSETHCRSRCGVLELAAHDLQTLEGLAHHLHAQWCSSARRTPLAAHPRPPGTTPASYPHRA